jgi:hypothetical protein
MDALGRRIASRPGRVRRERAVRHFVGRRRRIGVRCTTSTSARRATSPLRSPRPLSEGDRFGAARSAKMRSSSNVVARRI